MNNFNNYNQQPLQQGYGQPQNQEYDEAAIMAQFGSMAVNFDAVSVSNSRPNFPVGEFNVYIESVKLALNKNTKQPQLNIVITDGTHDTLEFCPLDPTDKTAWKTKRLLNGFGIDTTGANWTPKHIIDHAPNRRAMLKTYNSSFEQIDKETRQKKQVTRIEIASLTAEVTEHIQGIINKPQAQPTQPVQQPTQQTPAQDPYAANAFSGDVAAMFGDQQFQRPEGVAENELPF